MEDAFIIKASGADGFVEMLPGIRRRTLVWGERTLLAEFHFASGSRIPKHSHPEEQTGHLVSGRLTFHVEQSSREARPGDAWVIRGGVIHAVDVIEDSVVVEAFSPVRRDYIDAGAE